MMTDSVTPATNPPSFQPMLSNTVIGGVLVKDMTVCIDGQPVKLKHDASALDDKCEIEILIKGVRVYEGSGQQVSIDLRSSSVSTVINKTGTLVVHGAVHGDVHGDIHGDCTIVGDTCFVSGGVKGNVTMKAPSVGKPAEPARRGIM